MSTNNYVKLTGNLGAAPKLIEHNDKLFTAFSIATQDGYYNQDNEWQTKDSVWHQVLAFNDYLVELSKLLKKGERIEVTGSLSYRSFDALLDNKKTIKKHEATIIASNIVNKSLPPKAQPQNP